MITITKSNGEQVNLDIVKTVKKQYSDDQDVQNLTEKEIEDEYVSYITEYGLDAPICECIVENILDEE